MDRFKLEEGFATLKPLCDALMKEPSINNALNVKECMKDISNAVIGDLFEYILYPITIHLQNENISTLIKESLIETLRIVILKARVTKISYFNKLYACLLIQIYDKGHPNRVISSHEELKEVVLLGIKDLIHYSSTDVIEQLYIRENAPKLSQGIYLCVTIARLEKSRSLRLTAIDTVMALTQVDDESNKDDIVLQAQVADIIMLMLPGIASGLQEVATGSDIQGHKVTMMAIRAWGRIISLIMRDTDENEDDEPSIEKILEKSVPVSSDPLHDSLRREGVAGMKKLLETAARTREWLDAAATKLGVLMRNLNAIRTHTHYKVRQELAKSVGLLLTTCSRNMKPNLVDLIECLICLSEDDTKEVREEAMQSLAAINTNFTRDSRTRPLIELLEENFYNLLTKLPRIIRRSDDAEQLLYLNQVAGYLRLLGKHRVPHLMLSSVHMQRLLLALIYVIEIDHSNISLFEDISVKDLEAGAYFTNAKDWKVFKFIQDDACMGKVLAITKLLRTLGDFRILVDNILTFLQDSSRHRKELILLLNWAVEDPMEDQSMLSLYKEMVELYVSEDFWYPPIDVSDEVPLVVAQSNVAQRCLLVEGLSLVAKSLQQEYDQFLLKTLYLIIERAGSGHGLISFVGIRALKTIAESQGHETIGDLLRANVDYFSYHVLMKLRRVERNPGVLDVVGVVMRYSSMDVMHCLEGIVEDVLTQLNARFQERNSYAFLKVFHTFIVSLTMLLKNQDAKEYSSFAERNETLKTDDTEPQKNKKDSKLSETVIQSLLEYYEAKKVDQKIDEDVKDVETDANDFSAILEEKENEKETDYTDYQEETKAETPQHIKMVENVLKRCLHFLPSKDTQKSMTALLILQDGLPLLIEWEDILLPIVHQLWHPLVDRFRDNNVLIINRAWQLLCTVATLAKDFIRHRTLKQVWPALAKFLSDSAKESYSKDSGSAYKFTQSFKLQKSILSTLGQIARDLKLLEQDIWKILSITELYLNARQHPALQECSVNLYKEIADINEDLPWVKCLSLWHSKIKRIPTDASFNMKHLELPENSAPNEYLKNVETVIAYIKTKNADIETKHAEIMR